MEVENVKKNKNELPKYTLGEDLISSISHGIGVLLSIAALVLCVVFAAIKHNGIGVLVSCIYGISLIILYLMSCLYHAFRPGRAKKVFRIFDHCSIFLMIAGNYTPFLLITIGGLKGIIMLIIIWLTAVVGIVCNGINLNKFDKISFILYLIMGWMVIFSFEKVYTTLPTTGFILLLTGGIIYTIGAILYLIGNKVKYMHSIWHFFVLGGSIFQFFTILLYVI